MTNQITAKYYHHMVNTFSGASKALAARGNDDNES